MRLKACRRHRPATVTRSMYNWWSKSNEPAAQEMNTAHSDGSGDDGPPRPMAARTAPAAGRAAARPAERAPGMYEAPAAEPAWKRPAKPATADTATKGPAADRRGQAAAPTVRVEPAQSDNWGSRAGDKTEAPKAEATGWWGKKSAEPATTVVVVEPLRGQPARADAPGGARELRGTSKWTPSPPPRPVVPPSLGPITMDSSPWTPIPLLRAEAKVVKCPNCSATGPTKLDYDTGLCTWMSFCGLSMCGCLLGCCLVPFCVGGAKDVVHRCSSCSQVLARHERL